MTTLETVANRIQRATIAPNRHGIDPILIVALMQAVTQVVIACLPQPDDAAAYLRGEELRLFPRLRQRMRQRRIDAAIAREWRDLNGDPTRLADVQRAIRLECVTITPDVVADLYADVKARKANI